MKFYIDCTSAESEMCQLHNVTYTDPEDPCNPFLKALNCVFRKGQIQSKCGRSIIEVQDVLRNISEAIRDLPPEDQMGEIIFSTVLKRALHGITQNCAVGAGSDSYEPRENDK